MKVRRTYTVGTHVDLFGQAVNFAVEHMTKQPGFLGLNIQSGISGSGFDVTITTIATTETEESHDQPE